MSVGYAERLSFREDLGGQLGDPELVETSPEALEDKIRQLAQWVSCCIPGWLNAELKKLHRGCQSANFKQMLLFRMCLPTDKRGQTHSRLHGGGHQHQLWYSRLQGAEGRMDVATRGQASACSESQLHARRAFPNTSGAACPRQLSLFETEV